MIEVNGVSLSYVTEKNLKRMYNKALDGVTFTMPEGSVYGLLGTNGAGKSTLMRTMCGIFRPDEGSVLIDGREVFDNAAAKADICFVNDDTAWQSQFTLNELGKYYQCYYDSFSEELLRKMASALSLPTDRRLKELSKGMKRQAVTIVGMACRTKYLMLDESFDGLDPAMRRVVKDMLTDAICENGSSVLVSSHNVAEISEACDHVLLIHKGKLILAGEIDEVCGSYYKVQLTRDKEPIRQQEFRYDGLDVLHFSGSGNVVQLVVRGDVSAVSDWASNNSAVVADAVPLTLEEVFVYEMEARGYGKNAISEAR